MDVEVIHFEIKPCMRKLAQVLIRYEDIRIKCNLVYHVKDHKAWIRMPEMWSNTKEKMRYCYWESKELSDLFQKKIINIIFNKYNLNLNDLKHMHSKLVKKKTRKKSRQI